MVRAGAKFDIFEVRGVVLKHTQFSQNADRILRRPLKQPTAIARIGVKCACAAPVHQFAPDKETIHVHVPVENDALTGDRLSLKDAHSTPPEDKVPTSATGGCLALNYP